MADSYRLVWPLLRLIEPEAAAVEILDGLARGAFEIHFPRRFTRWLRWNCRC